METTNNSMSAIVDGKKREWIKGLLAMSKDDEAKEAFIRMQTEIKEKLYDYSFSNFFGLVVQTWARGSYSFMFGSFNKWKSLKRFVRKGEKAMYVLVPVTVIRKDKDTGKPIIDEKTGQPKKLVFFKVKNGVFSIDQTEANDGSKFESFRTVVDFNETMFKVLKEAVEKIYPVAFKPLDPSLGGFTDGKTITLNSERNAESQFCTLVHELSHCILEHADPEIGGKLSTDEREIEAELSTLIYCTLAGIDAKGSAHYLENRLDIEAVDMKRINRAIKAAGKIHEAVHPRKEKLVEDVA